MDPGLTKYIRITGYKSDIYTSSWSYLKLENK